MKRKVQVFVFSLVIANDHFNDFMMVFEEQCHTVYRKKAAKNANI